MSTQNGCVDDVRNPKINRNRGGAGFRFAHPKNPIPAQIEDREQIQTFFSSYRNVFVPYAGTDETTSHSLLALLISLCDLSPTQGAVIERIKSYSLGGKIEITRQTDPVFNLGETGEVTPSEKRTFYDFLTTEDIRWCGADDRPTDIRTFMGYNFKDYKATGNYFVELVLSETLGQRSARIYTHKPTHCLYLATEKDAQKFIAVSPIWSVDYVFRHDPDVLPLFPAYTETDGVKRTMFHFKNGNHVWYGRPDSVSSFLSQFQEFSNRDYKIKQTASQFVGTGLIEVEDDNPEFLPAEDDEAIDAGFDGLADRIEKNFTLKSDDPQPFILMSRPYGARDAFVFQFAPNTSQGWFKATDEQARKDIIAANQWSERLLGESAASGFSSNVFFDELRTIGLPVIRMYQGLIASGINQVFEEIAKFYDRQDLFEFSMIPTSPFREKLLDDGIDNSVGGDQVQPGER